MLASRSLTAPLSVRSSQPRVLIYEVPQAHQDPKAHQEKACQAHQAHQVHQDLCGLTQRHSSLAPQAHLGPQAPRETKAPLAPEDTKASKAFQASQPQVPVLSVSTCRDHQAHQALRDPRVTKVILESKGPLAFLVVPLKGAHHPQPCSCQAHQAHQGPLGHQAPSATLAWRFNNISLSTCRVTVLGLTCLEFRVPQVHLVPQGLSPQSRVRFSTTQSWQDSS